MKAELEREATARPQETLTRKPRVLVLEGTDRIGGGQRVTLDVLASLGSEFDFTVVAPGDGALQDELRLMGIDVLSGGYPSPSGKFGVLDRIGYLPRGLASVRRLVSLVRRTDADLIYATSRTALWAALVGRITGTPVVVHLHMVPPTSKTAWFLRKVCSAKAVKKVLLASPAIADRISLPAASVEIMPNGIDPDEYFARPELRGKIRQELGATDAKTQVAAVVGELSHEKGQLEAVTALRELLSKGHDVKLVLVGSARPMNRRYEAELRKAVSLLQLSDRVIFTGHRTDVARLLNGVDLLIVPSRGPSGEACPMVVLEAWAAGVPVLATSTGGLPDMLADGRGALFNASGQQSLAQGWQDLIAHPERGESFAAAGMSAVRGRYSQREAMARMRQVLRETISEAEA